MFQPETEDMLPRMAPKPSGSVGGGGGPTEPIIRPQVPEVSILFGQQQGAGGNVQTQLQPQNYQQQTQQTTSYATWKKQMLPKVTFPPILTQEIPKTNNLPESNGPRNNLYPMRTTANTVAPAISSNAYMVTSTNPSYVTSATDRPNNGYVGNIVATTYSPTYRQSLESYGGTNQPTQQQQQQQVNMYRKSVEVTSPPTQSYSSSRDVLTICAGTQTDTISSPNRGQQNVPLNVASKEDMEDLKQIVQEIRHNQLCLIQMMEKFICNQQLAENVRRVETKDMAIQVNSDSKESAARTNVYGSDAGQPPLPAPTNKVIQQLKQSPNILQTPKGKPIAQSTTYRPNSPQSNRLQEYQQVANPAPAVPTQPALTNYQQWNNQLALALPKPSTDKSLMMNELALKYLPNEKLVELLKELNVAQKPALEPPTTPLRNIENFERGPSDISNASYKYLKKYRLLPEDQVKDRENENPPDCNQQYYGNTRSPVQQRQSPILAPQSNSPYQPTPIGRLTQSPLARADITPILKNNMLDLDNIRQQPKFL